MHPDALTETYGLYSRQLYWYALSLCGDPALAEDLMQDSFVKAMLSYAGPPGDVKLWLFRVCRNQWIDRKRKDCRLAPMPDSFPAMAEDSESMLAREQLNRVYRAMRTLPEAMRELIALHCVMGLPHREIAELWGASPGAVRTLLCRARLLLKKKLEEDGNEL